MKTKRQIDRRPRWQFLYINEDHFDDTGERHWRSRVYFAPTIHAACSKMLSFMESRRYNVRIDYEARAEHLLNRKLPHEQIYPDMRNIDHEIREYVF